LALATRSLSATAQAIPAPTPKVPAPVVVLINARATDASGSSTYQSYVIHADGDSACAGKVPLGFTEGALAQAAPGDLNQLLATLEANRALLQGDCPPKVG